MRGWARDNSGRLSTINHLSSTSSDTNTDTDSSMVEEIPMVPVMSLKDRFYPTRAAPPSCIVHVAPVGNNFELKPNFISMLPKFSGSFF